jgi:predicted membrane protein
MGDRMGFAEFRLSARLVVGLTIIAVGLLFLFDEFDVLDAEDYLIYWPVALIAIGLLALMQEGSRVGGFIATGAGTWILLYNLNYLEFEIWSLWPLILVMIGGALLMQAFGIGSGSGGAASEGADQVNAVAVMGGVQRANNSAGFMGGDLTAIMGGCELDLTRAKLKGGEAVVTVLALWGGVEIRVPEDWSVIGKVVPIMGAFEDKTRPPRESSQRLVVKGMALMGGVEVKN